MKRKRMVSLFLVCGMMFLPVYSAYAENDSMDCSKIWKQESDFYTAGSDENFTTELVAEKERESVLENKFFEQMSLPNAHQNLVQDFVERLYIEILERKPDDSGLNAWTEVLQSGKEQGAKVAQGFIESQEFKSRKMNDTEYIKLLYRAFFAREADASGLIAWQQVLDSGLSRMHVFRGFAESDEFSKLCQNYDIQRGNVILAEPRDQNEGVTKFVVRCYRECLSRGAEEVGLNEWCTVLLMGKNSAKEVAYGFVFSDEFKSKNLSDSDYVKTLYRVFMGRDADAIGLNGWISALKSGQSRVSVLNDFGDSEEFQTLCNRYGIASGHGTFIGKEIVHIENYLENYKQLPIVMKLELVNQGEVERTWTVYEKDGFRLSYRLDIFSMKNSGDAVDLYGICIGETIQNADVILIKNGWKKAYDSYDGASCVYGTVLNGNAYMLELYKSDEKMESWYLNNWPQGDWGEEFYEQF